MAVTIDNPTISGTGVYGQIAYWYGFRALSSSAAFAWDATNSRLTLGSARLTAGISFPTSPSAGDEHLHTSRRRWYGFDGTRWLSEAFLLPLVPYYVASAQPFTATGQIYVTGLPPGSDLWIESFQCGHYFSVANSATNYWTVALGADTSAGTTTVGSYATSGATSAGYFLPNAVTSFSPNALARTSYFSMSITITKFGSAPAIEIYPSVRVREIG